MTPPEYWLRRLTIVVVCATVIIFCIWVMMRLFDQIAPIP